MKKISSLFLFFLGAVFLLTNCINERAEDCKTTVSFNYTWNILNADVFGNQIDEVSLFIFDEDGVFIAKAHDKGAHVKAKNYTMELPQLPVGTYQFVVWANDNRFKESTSYFNLPNVEATSFHIDQFVARLRPSEMNATLFNSPLNNALLGYLPNRRVQVIGNSHFTIPTQKVNNALRVVVIETDARQISTADYSIRIEEKHGNAAIKYDYSVLGDEPITYHPNYYKKVPPRVDENGNAVSTETPNAIAAEFAVSRLVENHETRLIIEDKAGKTVLDKSIIDLIYLLKHEGYLPHQMSLQEYLDRKDEFSISVYVSGDTSTWIKTSIIINGWVINMIDIDL